MDKKTLSLAIDYDTWLEVTNLGAGAFAPLKGFMNSQDYHCVVDDMRLADGSPWSLPVTLELPERDLDVALKCDRLELTTASGERVADLQVDDVFKVDFDHDTRQVFATDRAEHPGVRKERARSPYRAGGLLVVHRPAPATFPAYDLTPSQTRERFRARNWKTVVGFQTRNPPHRAHEYLQRIGLEIADGLFLQPLIGWKKAGDFTPRAIMESYELMVREFYPAGAALLGTLRTPMRYAGPREAVFHAIIRKNFGCTHFIVGRDHAGVYDIYGKYDAQRLAKSFEGLGITILDLAGPYFCRRCGGIVTEKSCGHGGEDTEDISGTRIREFLRQGRPPPVEFMREEVARCLLELGQQGTLFNKESEDAV